MKWYIVMWLCDLFLYVPRDDYKEIHMSSYHLYVRNSWTHEYASISRCLVPLAILLLSLAFHICINSSPSMWMEPLEVDFPIFSTLKLQVRKGELPCLEEIFKKKVWWARMELVCMVSIVLPFILCFYCVFEILEVTLSNVHPCCHSFQIDTCICFFVISK